MKKNKLLIVVDMQNDFVNGVLGTKEAEHIVPDVVKKIEAYKKTGDYVVRTMDTHDDSYMDTQEGQNLPAAHCIKGSEGWQLNADTAEALNGVHYIEEMPFEYKKITFGSWELGEMIKKNESIIESVELVGLCTGICVISNAVLIKALVPEMPILVDSRCCACVTPKSHETALEAMKLLQIKIL